MRKKNLTRQQKIFVASCGLKPENWYIAKQTKDYLYIVSKNGQRRLLKKESKSDKNTN